MSQKSLAMDKHIWVIRLRYLISSVLAVSFIISVPRDQLFEFRLSYSMLALAAIITIIVASNFIWIRLLKRGVMADETIGYYQCIFDLVVVTLIVHQYGASGFVGYLYVLVIFVAGVLLPRKGIVLVAAAASGLYLLLLLMETYGLTMPLPPLLEGMGLLPKNIQFLIDVSIKVFFFYLIAFSSANMKELLAKAQKESEFLTTFNQGIIDMVPMGVMVMDLGRNIVVYNPSMERTTMVPAAEAMGQGLTEVFPTLDASLLAALGKVESSGEELRLLGSQLPMAGGREVRVNLKIMPLKSGEQTLATVWMVQSAGSKGPGV